MLHLARLLNALDELRTQATRAGKRRENELTVDRDGRGRQYPELDRVIHLFQDVHITPSHLVLAKLFDYRLEHFFRLGTFAAPRGGKGFDFDTHGFAPRRLLCEFFERACCFAMLDLSAPSIGHASNGFASWEQISISLVSACDMAFNA